MQLIDLDQTIFVPIVDESKGGVEYGMEMTVEELFQKVLRRERPGSSGCYPYVVDYGEVSRRDEQGQGTEQGRVVGAQGMAEGTGGEIVAEFQEVTKLWRRMCISVDGNDTYKCERCPLGEEHICSFEISDIQDDEIRRVEEKVMSWAAEHPEPVYPTWYRWLIMMGAVGSVEDLFSDLQHPIPADIAEKLGIEPKEDA